MGPAEIRSHMPSGSRERAGSLRSKPENIRHNKTTVPQDRSKPRTAPAMSPQLSLRIWLGVLAVLLGLLVQTFHTHDLPTPASANSRHHAVLTAAEDHADVCPLCVAMHSASPAVSAGNLIAVSIVPLELFVARQHFVSRPRAFVHFSRPPPHSSF